MVLGALIVVFPKHVIVVVCVARCQDVLARLCPQRCHAESVMGLYKDLATQNPHPLDVGPT
jgi:hypothetical protein